MTREEAWQGLQGYSLFIADGTDLKEALNMAIEALKGGDAKMSPLQKPSTTPMQQSPSNGADLISRADAVKALTEYYDYSERMCIEIKALIEDIPSADAVSREDYEDIIKDYRKQYENMNNEIADLEAKLSAEPNYETDTEVRLAVTNRKKEKVILWDAFGEVEYYPIEALQRQTDGDLISRADAIEAVCDLYRVASLFSGGSDRREDWYEKAEKLLSKCPSADAVSREEYEEVKAYMDTLVDAFIEDGEELAESVKVVRCKDCQWCLKDHEDTWGNIDEYWCRNWGSPTDDCGYCHEAERREP